MPTLVPFPHFLMVVVAVVEAEEQCVSWVSLREAWSFLTSNLVFSAIILWNPIPTPSITASKHAHPIAEFLAAFSPPLTAKAPPVKNPAMTINLLALHDRRRYLHNAVPSLERHTSIVRIFLLSNTFYSTIKCRKETSPDAKIPSQYRRSCFNCCECAYPSLSVRRISKPFDSVPDRTSDCLRSDREISIVIFCI